MRALLLLVFFVGAIGSARAASYTLNDLCPGFRIVMRARDLVVQCPSGGAWRDWLTIVHITDTCPKPRAVKNQSGDVFLACVK